MFDKKKGARFVRARGKSAEQSKIGALLFIPVTFRRSLFDKLLKTYPFFTTILTVVLG